MEAIALAYNLTMLFLMIVGPLVLIRGAYVGLKRGLTADQAKISVVGLVAFCGALIYWLSGTPSVHQSIPDLIFMLACLWFGYVGFAVALWGLDPDLAAKLT